MPRLQTLREPVWLLNQQVCCCCCLDDEAVPAPCGGSTAVRQSPAAATGKEQLCRCSAAWLEAPSPRSPGANSRPPTHYLVCELCARILAHQRTIFSGVHKKRKAICGGYKSHLVLCIVFILNSEGERQCFSANLFSVCVNMYIFFNFHFVAAANSCF